jgi:hypothetical protein
MIEVSESYNILDAMPECKEKLRQRNTNCGTVYNELDHYLFPLDNKMYVRKVCCEHWKYHECLMKEAINKLECGSEAVSIIKKRPIRLIELLPNLCNSINDLICNANVEPIGDNDNTWLIISIVVIISLWLTYFYPISISKHSYCCFDSYF